MGNVVIRVEKIGKQYLLGESQERYTTLRDQLFNWSSPRWWRRRIGQEARPPFWALKDVSFEVARGEVVGIIGRNGAGKSTLLKILAQITEPTQGAADIYGRVGSLLEVGTGFHPELTGRENIYLNGAILGMKRSEINRKFDAIVAFAETEKFLDTQVKHYSSGMYMRLAFAVAAHLEPDILVVDEVLAVGDAVFQKKCLGKMGEVAREGRTVLFVSHNLVSVNALCKRAILLDKGVIRKDGNAAEVVAEYIMAGSDHSGEVVWPSPKEAPGGAKLRLRAVRIISNDNITGDVDIANDVIVEIDYWNLRPGTNACVSLHLFDKSGIWVLCTGNDSIVSPPGLFRARCTLPGNFLNNGFYSIRVILIVDVTNFEATVDRVISFNVHESEEIRSEYLGAIDGVVRPKLPWQVAQLEPVNGVGDRRLVLESQ